MPQYISGITLKIKRFKGQIIYKMQMYPSGHHECFDYNMLYLGIYLTNNKQHTCINTTCMID